MKKIIQKIFSTLLLSCSVVLFSVVYGSEIGNAGATFPLSPDGGAGEGEKSVELGKIIKEDAIDPQDSASEKIQKDLGVDYSEGKAQNQRATYYIQQLVNRFLAILGLVALIVLVYGFYKMFFESDGAGAYEDAMKIVKGAALALFVIGLSRFIVSFLFDIFYAAKEDI